MSVTIKISDPRKLGQAWRSLSKQMRGAAVRALQRTARYGATQAVRVSAKTRPRPRARGTYERSFVVTKLSNGAVLSNAAAHSYFVEVGRKPGKRPPIAAILRWMEAKKLARKMGPVRARAVAYLIARKIGRKGVRGRYVLKQTMPILAKRLPIEMADEMRRAFDRASRRGA